MLTNFSQTPTNDMIADSLTKTKSPYNYATLEANRLGVYELPQLWAQEGVLVLTNLNICEP